MTHPALATRLARLAPDQRAAATAPPGPVLCVAPAGSGKTTTLVARIAWLVDEGIDPATIAAITFNKRAAEELTVRLDLALGELGRPPGEVRVATFHALGREILADAGVPVEPLVDRLAILRAVVPDGGPAGWRALDTAISRLKLDLGISAEAVAADPAAGQTARAFVAYERAVRATGGLDFDDLVSRALTRLGADDALLARWRRRCAHLLVDEAQDLDRSQLRLALLLAAPANRLFLVGDDDQSIYGWRLADVRRILALADSLPGLRRVDLVTNYRCPAPVLARAVRLIERNRERFAKESRAGPAAGGALVRAPGVGSDAARLRRIVAGWPRDESTLAVLSRTNRELLPAIVVAVELGIPFRAPAVELPVESPLVDRALEWVARSTPSGAPLLVRLAALRAAPVPEAASAPVTTGPAEVASEGADDAAWTWPDIVAALIGWAPPYADLASLASAVAATRRRLAELRVDDGRLTLATAHATKGLEFDHVCVVGLEAGRFPSRRSVEEAAEPARALEEERRLAYVAWTRARRSLTLVYDPAVASVFLHDAFAPAEIARAGSEIHVVPG